MLRTTLIPLFAFFLCFSFNTVSAQSENAAEGIDPVNFYFPKNAYKFKVNDEIESYIKELKDLVSSSENLVVKLDGFAQDGKNDAWNTRVSKYRVRAVRDLLIEYGIKNEQIEIEYFGKTKHIGKDDSPRELAKNRRVELRIQQEG